MSTAAVYVRISADPTGRALGVARQEQDCRQLAARRGWDVDRVYADNDVSAFDKRKVRPAWKRLLDDLRAGRSKALVVYDMDRVARRTRDLDDLLDIYEQRPDLGFAAVTGEIDLSTSGGRMVARMLVSVATKSSEDTGRRVARKHLELAEKGLPAGGRRAFGYADDFMTVVEPEAAAIREAARRVLDGEPLARIIDDFHERGIHPPRAAKWSRPSLKYVLTSERVAGRRRHQGADLGPAQWPAILDEDTWHAVRTALSGRTGPNLTNVRKHLLSGIARCGRCGTGLIAKSARVDSAAAYACPVRREGGCGGVHRKATAVDDLVLSVAAARLRQPDAVALVSPREHDVSEHLQEIARLNQRLDQVAVDFAEDVLTAEQLRTITVKLRERISELQEEVASASRGTALDGLIGEEDVDLLLRAQPLERRRAVVDVLMTVTVLPAPTRGARFSAEGVRIEWKTS